MSQLSLLSLLCLRHPPVLALLALLVLGLHFELTFFVYHHALPARRQAITADTLRYTYNLSRERSCDLNGKPHGRSSPRCLLRKRDRITQHALWRLLTADRDSKGIGDSIDETGSTSALR
ncbi:hypothetical protein BKA70DRAFT_1268785 [Coprinopsis sp. MPI-PUGE-AT-0042]|nr:hypothetical protein BKA70DRAFT_1268785 [Coprinopsis sp. MPI-PUGE-AT-0042]